MAHGLLTVVLVYKVHKYTSKARFDQPLHGYFSISTVCI